MDVAAFRFLLAELGREKGCTFRDIEWDDRISKTDKNGLVVYNANFRGIPIVVKMMVYTDMTPIMQAFFMECRVYMEVINSIVLDGQCGNLVPAVAKRLCFQPCYKRVNLPVDTRVAALVTVVPPGYFGDSVATFLRKDPAFRVDVQYMKRLLFQMLYTLEACHERGLTHNDNHLGNWLVGSASNPVATLRYIVSPTEMYSMPGDFCVYLFDWDRSFTDEVGNNGFLSDAMCRSYGECNEHRPARDVFLTLCQLSDALGTLCNVRTPLGGVLHEVMRHVETVQNIKCASRRDEHTRKTVCRLLPSDDKLSHLMPPTLDLLRDPFFDDLRSDVPADLDLDAFTYVLPYVQEMERDDDSASSTPDEWSTEPLTTMPVQVSQPVLTPSIPVQVSRATPTIPIHVGPGAAFSNRTRPRTKSLGSDFEQQLSTVSSGFFAPKI